jgi:dTDP-4-dehydrorhamnose 3,5-epimerase-like enzyme
MPSVRPHSISFQTVGRGEIGYVSIAEQSDASQLPFPIQRVFWTYYTPNNVLRGKHCHYQLQEIVVAVAGKVTVELEELDGIYTTYILDDPSTGLLIPPYCWSRIHFSHSAVLMALCSIPYTPSDYIRDYEVFQALQQEFQRTGIHPLTK